MSIKVKPVICFAALRMSKFSSSGNWNEEKKERCIKSSSTKFKVKKLSYSILILWAIKMEEDLTTTNALLLPSFKTVGGRDKKLDKSCMLTLAKEGYTRFRKFHDREFCMLLQFSSMLHSKIFLGMLFRNSSCFNVVSMSSVFPIKF